MSLTNSPNASLRVRYSEYIGRSYRELARVCIVCVCGRREYRKVPFLGNRRVSHTIWPHRVPTY